MTQECYYYHGVCATVSSKNLIPNPYSAEIDFRRQIRSPKVDPRTERIKNV